MLKKNLRRETIYGIAVSFRTAIIKAKQNQKFDRKDVMMNVIFWHFTYMMGFKLMQSK